MEAGYYGESYVDHFLAQIDFPQPYSIIKGLHIQIRPGSFLQIDTLIITRKYIAILEIKNIKGKVYFQQNPKQLLRELNGESTTYKCPEQQITRHQKKLQYFLQLHKITIPIEKFIVFAFSSTHIAQPPQNVSILMGCDISNTLDPLNRQPDVISTHSFNKLFKALTTAMTEYNPNPLSDHHLFDWQSLQTGLICPNCQIKISVQTKCPSCKFSRKSLQILAIEDWFYLCKTTITNSECVKFLELKDKYAASYLLRKLELIAHSKNKYRYYSPSPSFGQVSDFE